MSFALGSDAGSFRDHGTPHSMQSAKIERTLGIFMEMPLPALATQEALRNAIGDAMDCPRDVLSTMSERARASAFPVAAWQREMLQAYELVLLKFFSKSAPGTWCGTFECRHHGTTRARPSHHPSC